MKRGLFVTIASLLILLPQSVSARFGFPEPVTERARLIEDLYFQITLAGILVFVVVFALLAFVLVRYRADGGKGRATYEKERDNLKAEAVWTVIPLVIMLWIGVISYQGLVELDDLDNTFPYDEAVVIDITASQYAWTADYQDSGASVTAVANADFERIKPFYVPADTPLWFRIGAVDVIHSFNVQALATIIDAVPGQINELLVADGLPAGWYFTQCREDCLTPGHSYMQAQIIAVSDAEYQEWTEKTLAGSGGGLEQVVPIEFDGSGFTPLKGSSLAIGATVHVQIANTDGSGHDFTFAGQTVSVAAGGLNTITFTPDSTGDLSLTSGGASQTLTVVEPETISVDLGAFVLEPNNLAIDAGTLYVIEVSNVHNAVHNLYIGMNGADGNTDALWNTGDLTNGQTDSILVEASTAGNLEMWCAVPGHYGAGMHGTVTVA